MEPALDRFHFGVKVRKSGAHDIFRNDRYRWYNPAMLPAEDEIHVWQAQLNCPEVDVNLFYETLSSDERDRAARLHFEKHRRRFIAARGILRALLSGYLDIEAGQIRFAYNPQGKPALAEPRIKDCEFNVSHSGDLAVFAFALGARIGVDVEVTRPFDGMDALALRFFSSFEYAMLQRAAPADRLEAFFNCWTRKEAYIKAEGNGLGVSLDSFTVSLLPGDPPRIIETLLGSGDAESWAVYHLGIAADATGAVAIPSLGRKVFVRQYT